MWRLGPPARCLPVRRPLIALSRSPGGTPGGRPADAGGLPQPLLRRNERRCRAGPCAPWIFPASLPPRAWEVSASLARLRSSASRNLRLASSSGLAPSAGLPAAPDSAPSLGLAPALELDLEPAPALQPAPSADLELAPAQELAPASGSSGTEAVSATSASCRLAGTPTASHTRYHRAAKPRRRNPRSEGYERQAHAGVLRTDRGIWRRLPPDLLGEFAGVVLVIGAHDQELPAPYDRPALAAQLVRRRARPGVRRELDPALPLGGPGGEGLCGFGVLKPLVLSLALGFGPRHRDVRGLPLLLDGVPALQGELRLNALAVEHVTGYPLGVPGGQLGARVEEDL